MTILVAQQLNKNNATRCVNLTNLTYEYRHLFNKLRCNYGLLTTSIAQAHIEKRMPDPSDPASFDIDGCAV